MTITKRVGIMMLTVLMLLAMHLPIIAQAATSHIYRRIEYGDSGADVTALQKNLKKLGFFSGKASGNYLDSTQRAVKAYQVAYGYKPTGYCAKGMQTKIYKTSHHIAFRTLHYGDNGEDVKDIQRALKKAGYFHGTIGGNYLKQTRAAVKAFQRANGLRQTNTCSVAMQNYILGIYK